MRSLRVRADRHTGDDVEGGLLLERTDLVEDLLARPQPTGAAHLGPLRVEQRRDGGRVGPHLVGEQRALEGDDRLGVVGGGVVGEPPRRGRPGRRRSVRRRGGKTGGLTVAAGPPGAGVGCTALLVCRGRAVREPVRLLVEGVTGVALDPLEADPAPGHGGIERLHDLDVEDRLAVALLPPLALPPGHPLGDGVDDVLAVAVDDEVVVGARRLLEQVEDGREARPGCWCRGASRRLPSAPRRRTRPSPQVRGCRGPSRPLPQ